MSTHVMELPSAELEGFQQALHILLTNTSQRGFHTTTHNMFILLCFNVIQCLHAFGDCLMKPCISQGFREIWDQIIIAYIEWDVCDADSCCDVTSCLPCVFWNCSLVEASPTSGRTPGKGDHTTNISIKIGSYRVKTVLTESKTLFIDAAHL